MHSCRRSFLPCVCTVPRIHRHRRKNFGPHVKGHSDITKHKREDKPRGIGCSHERLFGSSCGCESKASRLSAKTSFMWGWGVRDHSKIWRALLKPSAYLRIEEERGGLVALWQSFYPWALYGEKRRRVGEIISQCRNNYGKRGFEARVDVSMARFDLVWFGPSTEPRGCSLKI
ncbi:uncharacterized protein J3R85_019689 [Psidium guajava]|nr:uncharacterized protein J3R85_019689 [Psidium guajava]